MPVVLGTGGCAWICWIQLLARDYTRSPCNAQENTNQRPNKGGTVRADLTANLI